MDIRFDEYSWKARIAPVLIATSPLISVAYYLPQITVALSVIPVLLVAAAGLLAGHITRFFGKTAETRLSRTWDGLPTVRGLRYRSDVPEAIFKIRRRDVERIAGVRLPTKREEERDPIGSDIRYDDAVRRCLPQLSKAKHPLLTIENIDYGFRRNLFGLRPAALTIVALSILLNVALGMHLGMLISPVSVTIDALLLIVGLVWIFVVRSRWVEQQANTYADRFFRSIAR